MSQANSSLFMIDLEGTELSDMERNLIKHPHVGAVILFTQNFANPQQLKQLTAEIRAIKSTVFIATDHEGGYVQRFLRQGFHALPAARVYGDVYDLNPEVGMALAKQYGTIMAKDLLACGIDLSLAPVLDLQDNSPIIAYLDRAFHQDPKVITFLANAFIEGMNATGMPAVGKHFPGHGRVNSDSHISMPLSSASLEELMATDLKPFIDLIKKERLAAVMPAHVTYKAIDPRKPAGFSTTWLQNILREELGFKGLILSDCLSMTGADIGNLMTRAEEALNAGCDMLIVSHQSREALLELVHKIPFCQSDESAARISHFKNQMHRFAGSKEQPINSYLSRTSLRQQESFVSHGGQNQHLNTTKSV